MIALRSLLGAFLIAIMVGGLTLAAIVHFGIAENPVGNNNAINSNVASAASPNLTLLRAKTPAVIAAASKERSSSIHNLVVRLPNGTLCAAFTSNLLGTNFNDAVYVASSNDDGATWGIPVKISNFSQTTTTTSFSNGTATTNSTEFNQGTLGAEIVCDTNNNVYAVWSGYSNGDSVWQIWCTIYNGSAWSAPTKVSSGLESGLNAGSLSIAVDGNNKVHLVWDSSINGNSSHPYEHDKIFYAKYDGEWSSPTVISQWSYSTAISNYFNCNPCIAVDFNNNLYVVWAGSNSPPTEGDIWYTSYTGGWQLPVKLTTTTVPDMYVNYLQAPVIAVDSNNNLHVAWQGTYDNSLRVNQIWYMSHTNSWSEPVRISNVPSMNSSDQEYPSIAVDSNNRIYVLWMSARESVLFYSRHGSFTSWSTPIQIEGYSSGYPHLRWSTFPSSNSITTKLDYVFLSGSKLMFNSLSTSELPSTSLSVSVIPISEFIGVGQSLQFTSNVVGGTPPYSYQWYLNGTAISGAMSRSWIFKPEATGRYLVYVIVTDSDNNSVQSEDAQATATTAFLEGSFGYSTLSGESQGASSFVAYGSRYKLNVEANFRSMSALMSTYSNPSSSSNYSYCFAIYSDNNNSVGNLIAQTIQGPTPAGRSDLFSTAYFPSPVDLSPGAYWLMVVMNASLVDEPIIYGPQTNDYNASVIYNIGGMTFPDLMISAQPWLGHLYCIYASWEFNYSGNVSQENLFSVVSNSTVSSWVYYLETNKLIFTVSGPSNTAGYCNVYIPVSLISNVSELQVFLDGSSISYNLESLGNSWLVSFSYHHSTHEVTMEMNSETSTVFIGNQFEQWIPYVVIIVLIVIITVLLVSRKTKITISP